MKSNASQGESLSIESVFFISSGKLFQSSEAATEKARLPYELRLK